MLKWLRRWRDKNSQWCSGQLRTAPRVFQSWTQCRRLQKMPSSQVSAMVLILFKNRKSSFNLRSKGSRESKIQMAVRNLWRIRDRLTKAKRVTLHRGIFLRWLMTHSQTHSTKSSQSSHLRQNCRQLQAKGKRPKLSPLLLAKEASISSSNDRAKSKTKPKKLIPSRTTSSLKIRKARRRRTWILKSSNRLTPAKLTRARCSQRSELRRCDHGTPLLLLRLIRQLKAALRMSLRRSRQRRWLGWLVLSEVLPIMLHKRRRTPSQSRWVASNFHSISIFWMPRVALVKEKPLHHYLPQPRSRLPRKPQLQLQPKANKSCLAAKRQELPQLPSSRRRPRHSKIVWQPPLLISLLPLLNL